MQKQCNLSFERLCPCKAARTECRAIFNNVQGMWTVCLPPHTHKSYHTSPPSHLFKSNHIIPRLLLTCLNQIISYLASFSPVLSRTCLRKHMCAFSLAAGAYLPCLLVACVRVRACARALQECLNKTATIQPMLNQIQYHAGMNSSDPDHLISFCTNHYPTDMFQTRGSWWGATSRTPPPVTGSAVLHHWCFLSSR